MVSITAGVETTNERPVFVPRTNERPQRPVSVSRSHQHSGLHVGLWGVWPITGRGQPSLANGGRPTNHCRVIQSTERLSWRWDALITYFCF